MRSLRAGSAHALAVVLALVLGACAAAPTPAPSPTAAPTPTPGPSATPTPIASPTATPSIPAPPTSAEGAAIVDLFLSEFAEAQPPFHVDADIAITGSSTGTVNVAMDASGDDFTGVVHADLGGQVTDTEVVLVDGVAYGRPAGGEWQVIPDYRQTQPVNPFSRLDASQIAYSGPVERSGRILHQLRTTTWIGDDIEELDLSPITSPLLVDPVFDVFVGDDGIPEEAQLRFSITGEVELRPVRVDYVVDYRFSDVGVPVDIVAPEVEASPTP